MDIRDGEVVEVKGSAKLPYKLKNTGGVYSCDCPAWRNQSVPIERRTCKHLKKVRGEAEENERVGATVDLAKNALKKEVVTAPLLLAEKWTPDMDPTGWWMSEKLNGVRAWWKDGQFLSRESNKFYAPDWFTEKFPAEELDGELWMGRQMFQETIAIVKRHDMPPSWGKLVYMLIDTKELTTKEFEERQAYLQNLLKKAIPYMNLIRQVKCLGLAHLKAALAEVEAKGGEGLMLRQPKSLYEPNRSFTLLKVKSFEDEEAIILEYTNGKGNRKGMVGAFWVEGINGRCKGKQFKVGTGQTHKLLKDPPPIGTKITFSYVKTDLSKDGIPKPAAFVGLAIDR